MTHQPKAILRDLAAAQPYPLVFASLSGAHMYGFPSPDSDYDLRGVHCLPLREVLGLNDPAETIDAMRVVQGVELDIVTHDVKTYCQLLLKKNGNVLEQIMSPHIITTTPAHDALREIASRCVTKHFAHHYLGFSRNKWREFTQEDPKRIKTLLYVFRVLLTGIHLMRTSEVEPNLATLNATFALPYMDDLIAQKQANGEKAVLQSADLDRYQHDYERLTAMLEAAHDESDLPAHPQAKDDLNAWLIDVRLAYDDNRTT